MNGGRFDFDDGGTYCGGWEEGKAHGHGVCTGPKGQGEYSGAWHYGFEVSGTYVWPSGNTFEGQWQNGKRHGLGVERRGRWHYRGEWTQGFKGRYGVRQSVSSQAKFEGTWVNGLQEGYGMETYADGGTYQGQWLRGMRHGFGVRKSVPYGVAAKFRSRSNAHASLTSLRSEQTEEGNHSVPPTAPVDRGSGIEEQSRGGFVLRARSEPPSRRRSLSERSVAVKKTILQGLRIKKQRSTGDLNQRVAGATGETPRSLRSSGSTASCASDESAFTGYSHDGVYMGPEEPVDPNTTEVYLGEWKLDKRSGFGVSERSDGLKYEGEWDGDKKSGYGITTLRDGTKEEGKYKNNILVTSQRKKNLLFLRSSKLRERIDASVSAAARAAQMAVEKGKMAASRVSTARDRAEQADLSANQAREDSELARVMAKQFAPEFYKGPEPTRTNLPMPIATTNHLDYRQELPSATTNTTRVPMGLTGGHSVVADQPHLNNINAVRTKPPLKPNIPTNTFTQGYPLVDQQHPADVINHSAGDFHSIETSIQPPVVGSYEAEMVGSRTQTNRSRMAPQQSYDYDDRRVTQESFEYQQQQMQNVRNRPTAATTYERTQFGPGETPSERRYQQQPLQPQQQQHQQQQVDQHQYQLPPQRQNVQMQPDADRRYPQPHQTDQRLGDSMVDRRYPPTSSSISRTPSQSSSRYSVNQLITDHFDQYAVGSNVRQPLQTDTSTGSSDTSLSTGSGLVRRSTLASARDRPTTYSNRNFSTERQAVREEPASHRHKSPVAPLLSPDSRKGSVPDLTSLGKSPLLMTREEISRLSSQRREEVRRLREESELLHSNPLRYIFHPALRDWISKRKFLFLVVAVNLTLSFMFFQLLTYSKPGGKKEDPGD